MKELNILSPFPFTFSLSTNYQFMNTFVLFWQQETIIRHTQRLLYSFEYWTRTLLDVAGSTTEIAQTVFEAPFVIVSHGTQADPIFNYGNRRALELWEISWEDFTQIPSRNTAEQVDRLLYSLTLTVVDSFCKS
jgi:hypothetical protein